MKVLLLLLLLLLLIFSQNEFWKLLVLLHYLIS